MKMQSRLTIGAFALAALAASAEAQKSTIEGQLLGERGQPLNGAEIRIQSLDPAVGGYGVKTDGDGNFAVKVLPPSSYRVTIRVGGDDIFVANNIRTRPGDPWRIDYNMRRAVVTMSTLHSKKIRRFAWQGQRTGSQIAGRWVETDNPDGYEPEAEHVEGKSATAVLREMAKGHPGVLPGG